MKKRMPTIFFGLILPFIGVLVLLPLYNRITPYVFGFSFGYFWIFLWIFLTSVCLYLAYRLDPYNKDSEE